MKEFKEKKLRKIIRKEVQDVLFDPSVNDDKDEKIKSYNSSSSKITFYKGDNDKIFMRIKNKINGNVSDRIYIDDVEKFTKTVNNVNIIS